MHSIMKSQLPISPSTPAAPSPAIATQLHTTLLWELEKLLSSEDIEQLRQNYNRRTIPIMGDERFYRYVLDDLARTGPVISGTIDLNELGSRFVKEISSIEQQCFSASLRICMDVSNTSLTVEQIDALTDGVQSPTTIYGHARLVASMGSIIAEQTRIPNVTDGPSLDLVNRSILDQSQDLSQSDSHATRDAGLQSSLRKQTRSASTERSQKTNSKRRVSGRTKKQSQTILKVRGSARIAK